MPDLAETLRKITTEGGAVVWPLLLLCAGMCFALGERAYTLRRGSRLTTKTLFACALSPTSAMSGGLIAQACALAAREARDGHRRTLRDRLEAELAPLEEDARRHARTIQTVVMVAPLLGLLGTVSGMIETFSSLGDMALYAQSGGVAGGVAEALMSTQVGLVVAVPGLLLGRVLDRREQKFLSELELLKDLASQHAHGIASGAGEMSP